jgi:hypothetical protein
MANDTVLEAISLLTRVSSDIGSTLKKLSTRIDNLESSSTSSRGKEKLVKEATPVIVQDYGRKAEQDLARILGDKNDKSKKQLDEEKNKNNNLLKLLGLAGAAALALKFLFDGEGFTGLIQGFQKSFKIVTEFAEKAKGIIDDIGKKLGTFADDLGTKVSGVVDNVMTKVGTWVDDAKAGLKGVADNIGVKVSSWYDEAAAGLKNSFDTISQRLSAFGDDLVRGLTSITSKAKNLVGITDDAAKGVSGITPAASPPKPKAGFLSKAGGFLKDTAQKTTQFVGQKATQAGSLVKAGATAVSDTASNVGKFAKDKILKKFLDFMKFLKIKQVLGAIAKSPLLAPVIESVFAYKDVNKLLSDFQEGKISKEELDTAVGNRTFKALGGLLGGAAGATLLASMMGGLSFGLAAPLGAIIGGILGDVGGRFVADKLAGAMGDKVSDVGDFVLNTPLFNSKMGMEGSVENIEDGIITKDGKVIKPSTDDTIYAMKDGGPLADALNKTPTLLGNLINIESSNMELMYKNNLLLTQILEKINSGNPIITSNNTSIVNTQKSSSFRDMQFAV